MVAARRAYASRRARGARKLRRTATVARIRGAHRLLARLRRRGLLERRGDAGRHGRQGAGPEGVEQGAELVAHAAKLAADQPERPQMQQPPPTLGAQKPQYHRDDTGEGFSQVLGAVAGVVCHGRNKSTKSRPAQGLNSERKKERRGSGPSPARGRG